MRGFGESGVILVQTDGSHDDEYRRIRIREDYDW